MPFTMQLGLFPVNAHASRNGWAMKSLQRLFQKEFSKLAIHMRYQRFLQAHCRPELLFAVKAIVKALEAREARLQINRIPKPRLS